MLATTEKYRQLVKMEAAVSRTSFAWSSSTFGDGLTRAPSRDFAADAGCPRTSQALLRVRYKQGVVATVDPLWYEASILPYAGYSTDYGPVLVRVQYHFQTTVRYGKTNFILFLTLPSFSVMCLQ